MGGGGMGMEGGGGVGMEGVGGVVMAGGAKKEIVL